jgi:hypothetical protein
MRYPRIRTRFIWPALGAVLMLHLAACSPSGLTGPSGAFGEWVRGEGISVMVRAVTVDGLELPSVDFDNQSDAAFPVVPLKCTA